MVPRILLIDDEEGITFTFKKFLSGEGYEVSVAKNFDEALACIDKASYDAIFVDIILEGRSGIDILREIKERDTRSPVIMITGYPNIETASEAVRLGAFDYIPKPILKETLLHATGVALQYKKLIDEKEKYRINLEAIYSNIKDAIIMVDNNLHVLEVNDAANNICGFARDIIGNSFASLSKGCDGKCIEALLKTINEKDSVELHRIECQFLSKPRQIVTITTTPLINNYDVLSGAIMVVRDETRLYDLEVDLKQRQQCCNIIGKSEKMQEVYSMIELLTDVPTTVLITGESGTGKELVAEALHYRGSRSNYPLVKVNCSALSENLLESELFGHVKGAFTGAIKDKIGRFEKADGGSIFLDEIADISPRIQIKLLRVLQEMEFERVGDSTPFKVDVRIIAATNRDLYKKVREGEFREDLYYRLKVMEITLPPLRERREDIPLLVEHFLEKFNKKFNKDIKIISEDVKKLFMDYSWPGNIREMEHSIEHAFILCRQGVITTEYLPPELKNLTDNGIANTTENIELILNTLKNTDWNKAKAAKTLGISRRTLYRKIRELKITKDSV